MTFLISTFTTMEEMDDFDADVGADDETVGETASIVDDAESTIDDLLVDGIALDDREKINKARRDKLMVSAEPVKFNNYERIGIIGMRINELSTYMIGKNSIQEMVMLNPEELKAIPYDLTLPPFNYIMAIAEKEYELGYLTRRFTVHRLA